MASEHAGEGLDAPLERPAPPSRRAPRNAYGKRLPIIIGVLALAAFAGSIGWAYRQGMVAGTCGDDEVKIVRALEGPTRLKPETPGGMQVPNQDKLVYDRMTRAAPGQKVERLLPGAEAPIPKPAPEAAPAEPTPTETKTVKVGTTTVVPPRVPDAKPAGPESDEAASSPITPAVKPAARAAEEEKTASRLPPMPTRRPKSLPSGSFGLQLAALRNPNAIPPLWKTLKGTHVKILGKLRVKVLRITVGEKGIFHRLLAGPFPSEATARVACQSLKSRNQDCIVVRY